MPIGALEYARVWNTLDPNLREKVRKGEMSIEEASSYVVPIGDLELARARELPQGVGAVTPQQPGLDSAEAAGPPDARNSFADSAVRENLNLQQFAANAQVAFNNDRTLRAQRALDAQENGVSFSNPVYDPATGEWSGNTLGTQALDYLASKLNSKEELEQIRDTRAAATAAGLDRSDQIQGVLETLPANKASQEAVDAFNSGRYGTGIAKSIQASPYILREQQDVLLAQAALTLGGTALTRGRGAGAIASLAGGLGSATEFGAEARFAIDQLSPADRENPAKLAEALKRATKATQARMVVEAVTAPLAFGKTLPTKLGTSLASQGLGESGGEALASEIAGRDVSSGELALEALAGAPVSVVTETGGVIVDARRQDALRADLTKTLQQQADEAVASLDTLTAKREAAQRLAEANREVFDAELESDRMMEELRAKKAEADSLNNATQTEMPFGSGFGGNTTVDEKNPSRSIPENDRTPTIADMFTGESIAATKAEERRAANVEESKAVLRGEANLTDDEFELKSQRTAAARDSVDNRKQSDFEAEQQRRESKRALEAEDQTILKNERTLQSTADIGREAQRRLEMEKNDIRRRPENRRGIRNAKLGETLEAYERKRKPELIAEVREERLARINEARNRTIERENARTELDDIDLQAELDARSTERLTKEREAERPLADDLFGTPEVKGQQELLPGQITNQPNRPTYTGQLTEEEAVREAASLTLKRQRAREQTRPQEARKAQAAEAAEAEEMARAIDAEMPSIQAALDKQKTAKTNLTVRKYAAEEAKTKLAIIKEEFAKPDATEESVKVAAATRMAEWRKANPPPAAAPAPATAGGRNLVEMAEKVKANQDKAAKTRETKKLTQSLKNEMASGKTPEEAAAAVRDRVLSKQEDAAVRAELGNQSTTANPTTSKSSRRQYGDAVRRTTPDGKGVFFESTGLRNELDRIMASNSRTKPGDLLRAVIAHPEASRGEKWLANRLVGLIDNLDIKLIDVPTDAETATWGGAFIPSKNSTWIRVATAEVILHELLHAVTSNVISSKAVRANPKIASAVRQLNDVLAAVQLAYGEQQGTISGRLATILSNKQGPLSNTTELVSYALTEDVFMEWLETVPMPGPKKTAWQGFKDAIKTIFTPRNPAQNTALDEILEATSSLTMVQEQTPAINAWATSELRNKATRVNPQSIPGLLGNEESRKNTLNKTLAQLSNMYKNLAKAISATTRATDLGNLFPEFQEAAFETPIEEMANRIIENADLTTYRQKLGQMPRNLAKWAGLENKLVTEDGGLMPLFHGTRVQTGANGKSFSAFRLPSDSGQLGIHASVAPQVATTFNKKAGEMGLMSQTDDALYVMAGRMSNPLRLRDFGLWDARAILVSLRKSTNPQEISLAKELRRLQDSVPENATVEDADTRKAILDAGFDGIVYLNRMEMGLSGMVIDKVAGTRLDKMGIPLLPLDDKQRTFYNTTQSQNSAQVMVTLNSMSDEDFKKVFPEAAESYVFLKPQDVKSLTDNEGEFSESPDIYASDAGDVEVDTEEKFTNPVSKRKFWGPGGKLRPELKLKGKLVEAIADAVSAGGGSLDYAKGMRSAVTEVFERSGSETGSLIAEAEGLFKAMEISLRKLARRTKQDPEVVRAQFSSDVEQLEAMAPGLTKTQKAKEFADKYGNAARGYFAARAKIDSLSNEILQQRLSDPRPFTAEEAGVYRSIKENVGRYYSRVYAASTKGIGSRRAKRLVDEYERFIEKAGVDDKDGYEIVRNAIQYVSKSHLIVPDDDGLADMSLQELSDMADAWGIKVIAEADMNNPLTAEINRESLTEQLVQFRDATPQARQRQARVLVEELLFSRKHAALNKFYRGQAQNRTIVEERKLVPPEIRKLLGEYEDIPLKAMTTLIRMATFRSNTKVFNELLERTGGTLILTPQEAADTDISPEEWKQLPKSLSYGPLAGMWVRKDILPRIESTVEISNTFDQLIGQGEEGIASLVTEGGKWALEKWMGFAATVKMMQLVLNVANAGLNYGGGPVALVSNGNLSISSVRKAHSIATSLVASQASSHMTPDMLKIIRAGITDNAMMGSIRKVEAEKLEDVLFSHLESKGEKTYSRGKRKAAAGGRLWRETYAMADVVWKIANFLEEERKLTEYYKAEGTDMSAEAIEREAAWRTNQTNFSYKRVPNWLKAVEKGGITYVMPYVYETFRAPAASLMLGIADLNKAAKSKTPEGKQLMLMSGIKRTGGSLLAMGAMQMAMHAGAQAMAEAFGGEDDEWTSKLRVFMPDYKKFADLIYLGRTAEGKPVILEFSRFDPFGPSTEFFRMAMAGAEPGDYADAIGNLIIGNPYGRGIFQALVGQGGTNTRMQEMTPDIYAGLVDAFTRMGMSGTRQAKAIDLLLPSAIVRPFDPNNAHVEGDFSTWLFTSAGGQLHNVDPNKSVEFAVNDYSRNMENITNSFRTILKTQETTDEGLLSKLSQLREDEKDNFRKLQGLYDGMLELGYTPEEVLAQLAQRRVSKNTLAMLTMGGYIPEGSGIVSVRGLTQSWEAVNGSSIGVERKQRYYDNIVRTLRLVESGQIPVKE